MNEADSAPALVHAAAGLPSPGIRSIAIGRDALGNTNITGNANVVIVQQFRTFAELAAEAAAPGAGIGPNPYKGLAAFQEEDAARFFGREDLLSELWQRFRNLHKSSPSAAPLRLLPVLGPSGCGKSSLVRAGLIPELARRPVPALLNPCVLVLTPGVRPCEALATVLARVVTGDAAPVAKTREFAKELRTTSEGAFDGLRRIAAVLPNIDRSRLIVFVDQFEEAYSLCDNTGERDAFIATLLDAAADIGAQVSVILTLRSDFLGATIRHPALNQLVSRDCIIVPAMDKAELWRAIAEPARAAGCPLDPGIVELLVSETVGREGALPLLQFALTRIWDGLGKGKMPADTLKELGGVGGALASEADRLLADLKKQGLEPVARRAFLAMIHLGEGMQDTRRRARFAEIIAAGESEATVRAVLERFARPDQRLVSLAGTGKEVTVEITHEELIEQWPVLRRWVGQGRDDIRFHRRLAEAAEQWRAHRAGLWRPPELELLTAFRSRAEADFSTDEIAFADASVKSWQDERDREHRTRRNFRRFTWTVVILAIVLAGACASAFLSWQWERKQAFQALRNESLFIANLARQQSRAGQTQTAIMLSLEALPGENVDRPFVAEAEAALYDAVMNSRQKALLEGHADEVTAVFFAPDGGRAASASLDGSIRVWTMPEGKPDGVLWAGHAAVRTLTFGPAGIIAGTDNGEVLFWPDGAVGDTQPATLAAHGGPVLCLAQAEKMGAVLSGAGDGSISISRVEAGRSERHALAGHQNGVEDCAVSEVGDLAATASRDGTVRLWRLSTGQLVRILSGDVSGMGGVRFSPDGRMVAAAGWSGAVYLWRLSTNAKPEPVVLRGHGAAVQAVAFSPDGTRLASVAWDGLLKVWDVAQAHELVSMSGSAAGLDTLGFSPDGNLLVAGGRDGAARLWNSRSGELVSILAGHNGRITGAVFDPGGRLVLSGSADATARLWQVYPQKLTDLQNRGTHATEVRFSRDGKLVLVAGWGHGATLWTERGELLSQFVVHMVAPLSLHAESDQFAPDDHEEPDRSENALVPGPDILGMGDEMDADVHCGDFSDVGGFILTCGSEVRIWKLESGTTSLTLVRTLEPERMPVAARFLPHSDRLVTVSEGRLFLHAGSADDWRVVRSFNIKRTFLASFTFNAVRKEALITTTGEHPLLWRYEEDGPPAELHGHTDRVVAAAFNGRGDLLATAGWDGIIQVRNLDAATRTTNIVASAAGIQAATFQPDTDILASGDWEGNIRLWDARSGRELQRLQGHTGVITHVEFDPSGRRLLSASIDGSVRIWDVASGQTLAVLKDNSGSVRFAGYSPDGSLIVTLPADSGPRLWRNFADLAALMREGHRLTAGMSLSPDERRRFFRDRN